MSQEDILTLIVKDPAMMRVMKLVETLNLPDWWIGGGFIRSKVWDRLHNYTTPTPLPDIDVIYFDPNDFPNEDAGTYSTKAETKYEKLLSIRMPNVNWSVTNQARMHAFHNCPPYKNCVDALKDWVETATCIAVKKDEKGTLILAAPQGTDDLLNLILRPASFDPERIKEFHRRIENKNWLQKWPKLIIEMSPPSDKS